jgi:hypothetical protein
MAAARKRKGEPVIVSPVAATGDTAGDEEVLTLGSRRGRRRWLIVAVAAVLATGTLAGAIASDGSRSATHLLSSSPARSTPPVDQRVPVALGPGTPTRLAVADGSLIAFLADPATLVRAEQRPDGLVVRRSAEGDPAALLTVDPSSRVVWLIEPASDSLLPSDFFAYDLDSLELMVSGGVPAVVSAAAVLDGRLWLATIRGVYTIGLRRGSMTRLAGYSGPVHAIAADPTRHRLLATTDTKAARILQVQPSQLNVVLGPWLPLDTVSLAIVDGAIWVAGGNGAIGAPHVLRLDPATLRPRGPAVVRDRDFAFVLPGRSVVWTGSYGPVLCLDPVTGRTLQTWTDVQMPVASGRGIAFAFTPLWPPQVVPLRLGRDCPG